MKHLIYSVVVFVAVLLTYIQSVRYEFVAYDDHDYVFCNPRVMTGISRDNLLWAIKSCGYADNWHPITWMSLQFDASFFNFAPSDEEGYLASSLRPLASLMHTHNVILHAANAVLLFVLIVLLGQRLNPERGMPPLIAALCTILWAIHPLRTEVVCWVSERKELVSVFWMLLTLIVWTGKRSAGCYLASLLFFALAILAKPVAVTLPFVLFSWDWVVLKKRFARAFTVALPFLCLSIVAATLTFAAQKGAIDVGSDYSAIEKVVMSLSAPAIYLRQTLCPTNLSAFYPLKPPVPWIECFIGVMLFGGSVVVCVMWLFRRSSYVLSLLSFAVAWCLVSLLPMLGIIKVGNQTHSDRYTYWVGCGLAVIMAMGIRQIAKAHGKILIRALGVVAVIFFVATLVRMPVWKNSIALFSDAVPKSWAERPVCALSWSLRQKGKDGDRQAEMILREAVTRTHSLDVTAEFAHLLACRAESSAFCINDVDPAFAEPRFEAQSVLSVDPKHPLANEAMAIIEMKEGKWGDACGRLELARTRSKRDLVPRIDREIAICRRQMNTDKGQSNVQK